MLCFAGTLSFDFVKVMVHAAVSAPAARSNSVADVSFPVVGVAAKCQLPATSAAASAGAGAGAGAAAGAIAAVVSFGASFFAQAATASAAQQRASRDVRIGTSANSGPAKLAVTGRETIGAPAQESSRQGSRAQGLSSRASEASRGICTWDAR